MHAITWVSLALLQLTLLDTAAMQGNGFAAKIVGGFFALGILVLFARWATKRPGPPRSGRR